MSAVALVAIMGAALSLNHVFVQPKAEAPAPAPISVSAAATLEQARKLDGVDMPQAVKLYREASIAGSGAAAKRLYEIHLNGEGGVERDMAEARRQLYLAQVRGEDVPVAKRLRVTAGGHVQMY